jgi:hypothetical protein
MSEARHLTAEERSAARNSNSNLALAIKRYGIYIIVALIIFLAGLIPMWLKANSATSQLDASRRELQLSTMQNKLASSAIDAQRGEYETARQEASDFNTALREQLDKNGDDAALTQQQRDNLQSLLKQRDEVITLLARSDPAAAPRLLDAHATFRKAILSVQPEGQKPQ